MRRVFFFFQKLIREIGQEICSYLHFQVIGIKALQEAAKSYLVGLMEDSSLYAMHAKHVTIMPKDMQFVCKILGGKLKIYI